MNQTLVGFLLGVVGAGVAFAVTRVGKRDNNPKDATDHLEDVVITTDNQEALEKKSMEVLCEYVQKSGPENRERIESILSTI